MNYISVFDAQVGSFMFLTALMVPMVSYKYYHINTQFKRAEKNIKTPVLRFLPGRHFKRTLSQQHRAWKCLS